MATSSHIGPFEITGLLGRGGMGEVYRARLGRAEVAVKVLTSDLARRPERRAAFLQEVRAVVGLSHPAIVTVHDYGTRDDGSPWMAMALASQGTLHKHLPTDWKALREVLIALLRGLAHAHAHDVIHRDLKPSNVLWCGPGDACPGPVLADFGLSMLAGQAALPRAGTPRYMAPEQFMGLTGLFGPWTDLYALGAMAWHLASGAPPFRGTPAELGTAHTQTKLPQLQSSFPVPVGFESWLARAMAKAPSDRFACAADAIFGLPGSQNLPTRQLRAIELAPTVTVAETVVGDFSVSLGTHTSALAIDHAPLPSSPPSTRVPAPLRGVGLGVCLLRRAFVGREADLQAGWDRLLRAVAMQQTHRLHLHGPAGVGKTRTGEELVARARAAGCAGLCVSRGEDVVMALRRRLGATSSTEHLEARLGHPLVLDAGRPWASLRRWAGTRPLVLLLDHPDADQLRVAESTGHPGLIVTTGRQPAADGLALQALPESEWPGLFQALLGVSRAMAGRLGDRCQGLPGVAVALAEQCLDQDLLRRGEHGLVLTSLPTGEAPTVSDPSALALAAALGPRVDRQRWQRLLGRDVSLIEDQLLRQGVVQRVPGGLRFCRAGAIEAIAQKTPDWAALNGRCADAVTDPEAKGLHLIEANRGQEAIDLLLEAAHQRHFRSQYHRARDLFQRRTLAMHGLDPDDQAWPLGWTREAVTWRFLGDFERCESLGARTQAFGERVGDENVRADGLITQALAMISTDRADRGLALLDDAMQHATDAAIRARGHQIRAHALLERRRVDEAERDILARLAIVTTDVHRASSMRLLASLAMARGDLTEMRRHLTSAGELYERVGDRWGLASVQGDLGVVAYLSGDLDAAAQLYTQTIEAWVALGSAEWSIPMSNLSLLHAKRGAYGQALTLVDRIAAAASERANLVGVNRAVRMAATAGLRDEQAFDQAAALAESDEARYGAEDMAEMAQIAADQWVGGPRAARARRLQKRWSQA